jgi:hypothetical protein
MMSEPADPGPVARHLVHAAQELEMAAHFARARGGDHSAAFAAVAATAVQAWVAELDRTRSEPTRIDQVYTALGALADVVRELALATEHLDLSRSAPSPTTTEQQEWNAVKPLAHSLYEELNVARQRAEEMDEALQDHCP